MAVELASFAALASCRSCAAESRSRAALNRLSSRADRRDKVARLRLRIQLDLRHAVDLEVVIEASRVELGAQVVDDIRVGDGFELGRVVVGPECLKDVVRAVCKIENIRRVLSRMRAVEARERLHGLNARERGSPERPWPSRAPPAAARRSRGSARRRSVPASTPSSWAVVSAGKGEERPRREQA
jgi:hypothetical protein